MAFNSYTGSSSTIDKYSQDDLKKMDTPQLKIEMKKAIDGEDDAYFDLVKKAFDEKLDESKNSIKGIEDLDGSTKSMKEALDEISAMPETTSSEKTAKTKAMKDFFKNDMKNWVGKAENISSVANYQKNEAERLQSLLDGATQKKVKINEMLPFGKMGRLKRINHKIQQIKEKFKNNRAKPVLQFLMSIVESNHTGYSQTIKRATAKIFWNKKSQNINEELKVIQDKIKPTTDDGVVGTLVKESIGHTLEEAKVQYLNEQKQSLYGRAA